MMPADIASGMVTKTVLLFLVYSTVASYGSDPDNNDDVISRNRDILKVGDLYQRSTDTSHWENPFQGHQRILKLRDIANRLSGRGSRRTVSNSHSYFYGPSQKQILRRVLQKLRKILRKNPKGYAKLARKFSDDPVLQTLFIRGTESNLSQEKKPNDIRRKNKANKFQDNLNPSIEDDSYEEKAKEIATKSNSNKSKTNCKQKRSNNRQRDDLLSMKKKLNGRMETIISGGGHFGAFRPVKPYSTANSDRLPANSFQANGMGFRGPPAPAFQNNGFGSFGKPAKFEDSVKPSDSHGLDEVWYSEPLPDHQLGAKELRGDFGQLTDTWRPRKESGIRSAGITVPEHIDTTEDYDDC